MRFYNTLLIKYICIILSFEVSSILADSSKYNSFNNHGAIGLINIPSARFYNEESYGITFYDGTPDQKVTLTSSPYDWLEASFFYTNIQGRPYPGSGFTQDYKDKGFNFKVRIKEEGLLPAIAIGVNDIGGTGLYGSEYIVGSYGINRTDFHFGIGWGQLAGGETIKNPLIYLSERFRNRTSIQSGANDNFSGTGEFRAGDLFSGDRASIFYGISYVPNEHLILKIEKDPILTPGEIDYIKRKSDITFGLDYKINKNFTIGLSSERDSYYSLRFNYKYNSFSSKARKIYVPAKTKEDDDNNKKLIRNLRENGIGVNKILETSDAIGIELTQFIHPNLDVIEEIISQASIDAGIDKEVKTNLKIVDLDVIDEIDESFVRDANVTYERKKKSNFYSNNNISFRPFLASREEFFKGAILLENNSEYVLRDNFIFSSNLKYSIYDNFDDFNIQPRDTYPAQVRSDVKDYLKNFSERIIIGRAQIDYFFTPKKNNHIMFTAGILEEMFSGAGFEYLYFNPENNYALGFEVFDVIKRDYDLRFGNLDYRNVTGSVNFYYRNYNLIPFDMEISYGEYLAGDEGITLDISRSFPNGTKYGVFASFTDVSSEQFGEGSFDKGIYFNIPIFGNFINYTWRPLTKDPGAKLIRQNTLYDLLVKFRPIN